MAIAIGFARFSTPRPSTSKFDRLWFDFFDTFGIVWGRRIQDRFNFVAEKEDWPSRLDLHGLNEATATNRDSRSSNPEHQQRLFGQGETNSRMEHVFRWLLRRFVDPEWIDQRLGAKTDLNPVEVSVDS